MKCGYPIPFKLILHVKNKNIRNCNLKIYTAPVKCQAQGTSLFTSAATNRRLRFLPLKVCVELMLGAVNDNYTSKGNLSLNVFFLPSSNQFVMAQFETP